MIVTFKELKKKQSSLGYCVGLKMEAFAPSGHADSNSYRSVTAGNVFDPGPVKVTFVTREVILGQALLQVIWFISVSIIQCYVPFYAVFIRRTSGRSLENFKIKKSSSRNQKNWKLPLLC